MAQRMLLVSEQELGRLQKVAAADQTQERRQTLLTSPALQLVIDLDSRLRNIIQRTDLDDSAKVSLYDKTLSEYQQASSRAPELTAVRQAPTAIVASAPPPEQQSDRVADILLEIPQSHQKRFQRLLKFLQSSGAISWDPATSELILKGQRIIGSNAGDILKQLYKPKLPRTLPLGFNRFMTEFSSLRGASSELMSNPQARKKFSAAHGADEEEEALGSGVKRRRRVVWESLRS